VSETAKELQSITELVASKDKLIEQMREALENLRKYPATYIESGHQNPILRAWRHRKM
jgi:restriction endonuclease S subunit